MQEAIIRAVIALSNIPYAPQDPDQQDALMEAIARFADQPDGLAWAVSIAIAKWKRWLGPAELRALYCSRFRPADGIEADVMETPGFTAADNEAAYMDAQGRDTAARMEQWKREAAQLPEAERQANLELLEALQTPKRLQ
jgi:hypothetical protein